MLDVKTRPAHKKAHGQPDSPREQPSAAAIPASATTQPPSQPDASERVQAIRTLKDGSPFNEIDIDIASLA
jgi:hypothetical protein